MRDPKRIQWLIPALETLWEQNPDLRLGQLIMNLGGSNTYNAEDADLLQRIYAAQGGSWPTDKRSRTQYALDRLKDAADTLSDASAAIGRITEKDSGLISMAMILTQNLATMALNIHSRLSR